MFPVQGRTDAAVGSFWGADRDQGARRHEGIDIFAPRGTAVVAAAAGVVTRTGETPVGGRVVWLAEAEHGSHLYYAHLDRQLVTPGQMVRAGDTLGLVGNTGNARHTVPHLHFGIYRTGQGAVDPFPFVRRADPVPAAPGGAEQRGEFVRLRVPGVLHAAPSGAGKAPGQRQLIPPALPLLVLGRQGDDLRVQTPTGQLGYVAAVATVAAAAAPLRRLTLRTAIELRNRPALSAPVLGVLPGQAAVVVLGQSAGYRLLRSRTGQTGWGLI